MNHPDAPRPSSDRRRFLKGMAAGAVATGAVLTASTAEADIPSSPQHQLAAAGINFRDIQAHENAHAPTVARLLGSNARPRPTFQNLESPNIRNFYLVSASLENTGVAAYLGAAPYILSRELLAAAGSIALIEARHAGWLNSITTPRITTNVAGQVQNFETPFSQQFIRNKAMPFIADLNNGPPLQFSTTPSAQNDIDILNFALALEYLEQAFYNINVPRFFPA